MNLRTDYGYVKLNGSGPGSYPMANLQSDYTLSNY